MSCKRSQVKPAMKKGGLSSAQKRKNHWPGVQKTWRDKRDYDWLILISYFDIFWQSSATVAWKIEADEGWQFTMFVPAESPLVTTMPNSNIAGPYGRQADGSKEVLPRSKSAAINPRAIWGAAWRSWTPKEAGNGHQMAISGPFFASVDTYVYTSISMKQHFSQHETTTTAIPAYYCI